MTSSGDPSHTRRRLLEGAFSEIYQKGFQAAGVNDILARTGLTRGALYHHFPSKTHLGYAVVDELIAGYVEESWVAPLTADDAGIDTLKASVARMLERAKKTDIALGCPLNNLAQEMAPLDEGFRERIAALFERWRTHVAAVLRREQEKGRARAEFDPDESAAFIVAAIEGGICLAKGAQDGRLLQTCFDAVAHYLESLQRVPRGRRGR